MHGERIELVKDANKEESSYTSVICKIRDEHIHDLAVLKECLDKVGISMEVMRFDTTDILSFSVNHDVYDNVVTRKAGRKKDHDMFDRYAPCTVSELKMKLKSMKKVDIMRELGCPKATFYRILSNLEADGYLDGNGADYMQIWYYTC